MRCLVLIPLALLTSACWSPGPSQVDPTLYPWHSVTRKAPGGPSQGVHCVVALQAQGNGITPGGKAAAQPGCPELAAPEQSSSGEPDDQSIWIMCGPPPEERRKPAKAGKPDCSG